MLFVFVCELWCPTHIVLCFCFVCFRLVYPVLPASLDCPFLIAPSVFSSVYLHCNVLYFFSDPIKYDQYFVGASDIEEEGVWTWITNQSSSNMVFNGGRPNKIDRDYGGQEADCAAIRIDVKLLVDEYCLQTKPYVCEDNS